MLIKTMRRSKYILTECTIKFPTIVQLVIVFSLLKFLTSSDQIPELHYLYRHKNSDTLETDFFSNDQIINIDLTD